jgi:hypothetical protein
MVRKRRGGRHKSAGEATFGPPLANLKRPANRVDLLDAASSLDRVKEQKVIN